MSNDVFRKNYKEISEEDQMLIKSIKEDAEAIRKKLEDNFTEDEIFLHAPDGFFKACERLEEFVMWATKAITAKYYED